MHVPGVLLGPDTSWLLRTDALLGLFTLLCLAIVVVAIVRGVMSKLRARKNELIQGFHPTRLSQLGITLSNGEEQPDEKDLHPGQIPAKKEKDTTHTG